MSPGEGRGAPILQLLGPRVARAPGHGGKRSSPGPAAAAQVAAPGGDAVLPAGVTQASEVGCLSHEEAEKVPAKGQEPSMASLVGTGHRETQSERGEDICEEPPGRVLLADQMHVQRPWGGDRERAGVAGGGDPGRRWEPGRGAGLLVAWGERGAAVTHGAFELALAAGGGHRLGRVRRGGGWGQGGPGGESYALEG